MVDPVEEVGDLGEGHTLEEGGLEAWVPTEVGQTDQGKELEEAVCRHGLVDQGGEGGGPGQEAEVLGGLGDLVGQEGDVEDPAFLLCHASSRSCPRAGRD